MLNDTIKKFIQDNIDLIENNDWVAFYKEANDYLSSMSITSMSEALLKADINPLNSIDIVPAGFLFRSDIKRFKFPDNIKVIDVSAFEKCENLETITLNEGLERIKSYAFELCKKLGPEIYFPDSLEKIGHLAFKRCDTLKKLSFGKNIKDLATDCFDVCSIEYIEFRGSKEEFDKLDLSLNFKMTFPNIDHIECVDGSYSQISGR